MKNRILPFILVCAAAISYAAPAAAQAFEDEEETMPIVHFDIGRDVRGDAPAMPVNLVGTVRAKFEYQPT